MEGLFIGKKDTITINFVLAKTNNGRIIAYESKSDLEEAYKDADTEDGFESYDKESVEEHKAVFRRPSFGDTVHMGQSVSMSDLTSVNFDPWSIRFHRMRYLLKSWTLEDNGKPVPADEESLKNLHPTVANIIGIQLEAEIGSIL